MRLWSRDKRIVKVKYVNLTYVDGPILDVATFEDLHALSDTIYETKREYIGLTQGAVMRYRKQKRKLETIKVETLSVDWGGQTAVVDYATMRNLQNKEDFLVFEMADSYVILGGAVTFVCYKPRKEKD